MKQFRKLMEFIVRPAPPTEPEAGHAQGAGTLTDAQFGRLLASVRSLTMVHESGVRFTAEQAVELIQRNIMGVYVECGVWRGGCSLAMLLAQRYQWGRVERPVYMLDSFEGLPPVTPRDGPLAVRWQNGADPANYSDNCKASLEDLKANVAAMGFGPEDCTIVPGWFNDTVPLVAETLKSRKIALLRLDGDWYDSTLVCLERLMPVVSEGGVVIIDDYYAWDGCARAVHDYLSHHDLPYRIRSLFNCYAVYFVKKSYRDRFEEL
jgi:O-methyltransferase